MILTTSKNERVKVKRTDRFEVVGDTKINVGCIRWFVIAFVFFPLLILFFFAGDKVKHIKLNGTSYLIDQHQFQRLVDFMDGWE